ncbi:MAG: LON peptidase substrate-binding domain-containing protein [Ferruginibacter sp.]
MTNFIPIFPLNIVVYPGEELNLHIFEPRYKELINDCISSKKMFGIPCVLKDRVNETGTLVEINEVVKVYDDGRMDIKTKGNKIFRVLEVIKEVPDKLYSGAIVNYPHNDHKTNSAAMQHVLKAIRELHNLLKISKDFKKPDEELCSYDMAHHAGLSLEEEYELLQLMHELQRLEYLKQHIVKVLPVVAGLESLKDKIKMNGHFKNLSGFDI